MFSDGDVHVGKRSGVCMKDDFKLHLNQKRPDVHKIVLSLKLRSPPRKKCQFRGLSTDLYSFPTFWGLFGGGVNQLLFFADKNFVDTQTFLTDRHTHCKALKRYNS